jgi:4-hydroxythreonine-4-phosphate dehydrogenase
MGGTRPHVVLPVLAGTGIRYYPFPGEIVGHPSALAGTTDAIVESACRLAAMEGVHGLDLLAYRFRAAVIQAGAAGFTVGTAALDGAFTARSTHLTDQLAFIVERARPR